MFLPVDYHEVRQPDGRWRITVCPLSDMELADLLHVPACAFVVDLPAHGPDELRVVRTSIFAVWETWRQTH